MIKPVTPPSQALTIRERVAMFEHGHLLVNKSNLDCIESFEKELEYKRECQGYLSPEDLETLRVVLHYKTEMLFKVG